MPVLDIRALQRVMTLRNVLFKHQLANLVGISYGRLTQIIANGESDVEQDILDRLCTGLDCEPGDILTQDMTEKRPASGEG